MVWTTRSAGSPEYLLGTAFINNHFMLVGGNGDIQESDNTATMPLSLKMEPSANGMGLVVFAPLGSSFHLQASASLSAPNWSAVAGFTNALAATQWTDPATNFPQRYYRAISP